MRAPILLYHFGVVGTERAGHRHDDAQRDRLLQARLIFAAEPFRQRLGHRESLGITAERLGVEIPCIGKALCAAKEFLGAAPASRKSASLALGPVSR